MKLIDALTIIQQYSGSKSDPFRVALICGFAPLHFQTFLHAEIQQLFAEQHVEIVTGLYGDLTGTLQELNTDEFHAAVIVLEWPDLDARFGIRQLGGWSPNNLVGTLERTTLFLSHLRHLLENVARSIPVVLTLPSLPLPPIFFTAGWQAGDIELKLKETTGAFGVEAAKIDRVRVLNGDRLDRDSPVAQRLSAKSEWASGFPYQLSHASTLASLLAKLVKNQLPKKGLITDLDNTLWSGIVGEVGAEGISWDQDHKSAPHGYYQQMLKSLSEEGVLIGVASKNEPSNVEKAFRREDLVLPKNNISLLSVSWGSKAQAVSEILTTWNIGPDSVVFIDDSPLELAEVRAVHPEIECLLFPYDNSQGIYELVSSLRDLFGKEVISDEDRLRMNSIRRSSQIREITDEGSQGFSDALLEQAEAELTLNIQKDPDDKRAFELVNKTNQFNLNGRRVTEAAWAKHVQKSDTFLLTVSYRDRFGTLGKIAVMTGRVEDSRVNVDTWVMSCRAFARRIEHQCVKTVFEKLHRKEIVFDYIKTARNGPVERFFSELLNEPPISTVTISRDLFDSNCPKLFHRVVVLEPDNE
jgi:FkbH-like protein